MRRPTVLLALLLPLLVLLAAPSSAAKPVKPSAPVTANRPILFVHGWNSSAATWDTMVARFKAAGWTDAELHRWSYNTSQSNATTAQEIAVRVADIRALTGVDKVDVIAHSMGSLSSRYFLKNLGGDAVVDDWISLGGPNHGIFWPAGYAASAVRRSVRARRQRPRRSASSRAIARACWST